MLKMMGAINTRGFSCCIETGVLPPYQHITYEGVFNQLKFDVGPKTQKTLDCHFGYARYQFSQSLYDPQMNDYLCIFLKSQRDGAERNDISLNTIICLDISGSMDSPLEKNGHNSRLQLSIEAIKMFISKLRPNDSIGIVVFDTKADVIFEPTFKKDFKEFFYDKLDQIKTRGGTTIQSGLTKSKQVLNKFISQNQLSSSQNRIIILTDVCDNSVAGSFKFIQEASKNDNIHITIIGVSNEFRSQTCQALKNIKGFNYFCAINHEDIKKHIFQDFNFNYLPVAHNILITIQSENIQSFQIFGAPDSSQVAKYNDYFKNESNQFTISKLATAFPSQVLVEEGKHYTVGGVILMKLKKKSKSNSFKGLITLSYQKLNHQLGKQKFQVEFNFPIIEQFYSEQFLRESLQGYAFTAEIKNLLKNISNDKDCSQKEYLNMLKYLNGIVPEAKKKDLQNIRKIIQKKIEKKIKAK